MWSTCFAAPIVALLTAQAALAGDVPNATIVASTVPELPVGRSIGDAEQVYVPENTSISVLFRDGRTVTVNGPMFGVLVPALGQQRSAASPSLMLGHDTNAVGATRALDGERTAPRVPLTDPRATRAFDR
jgi:hypothetical protein